MLYFDTSYLARLYLEDAGAEQVRKLAGSNRVACSLHGGIETIAAFHRAYRESRLKHSGYLEVLDQFVDDDRATAFTWLPIEEEFVAKLEKLYRRAPDTLILRAGDALHLMSARENGFKEIYSHDKRMLDAAPIFGLRAKNIIR